jgi:hypothetical protein
VEGQGSRVQAIAKIVTHIKTAALRVVVIRERRRSGTAMHVKKR